MKTSQQVSILAAWLLILLACAWQLHHTSLTHDLTQFMPSGANLQQKLTVNLLRKGPASRLILIMLEGDDMQKLANASREMTGRLRDSGLFAMVANGSTEWSSAIPPLFRYRYLLDSSTDSDTFNAKYLRAALQQRLTEISGALPLLDSATLASDPTAAIRSVLRSWQPSRQPRLHHGVWFTEDERGALITAIAHKSGFDPRVQQQIVDTIREIHTSLPSFTPPAMVMSGAPVFTSEIRHAIRSDMQLLSAVAGLLVTVFLLLVYRSFRLLVLGSLPLLSALVTGAALTSSLFGSLHGITLVFGITLLGVAIDYPVHLFSHLASGRTPAQSMARIWPTIRLGMITTCIGYLALVQRDFNGLAQLGIFTGTGLATAAAVTRWVLPPLIHTGTANAVSVSPLIHASHLPRLPGMAAWIIPLVASIAISSSLLLFPPKWESDLASLSPIPSRQLQTDARLRAELGAADARLIIAVSGDEIDSVLAKSEQVANRLDSAVGQGLIEDYEHPARYLPDTMTQIQRQQLLPDRAIMEQNLATAMEGLPFRMSPFQAFLDAIDESRTLQPLTVQDLVDTPVASRIDALMLPDDHGWIGLIMLVGLRETAGFHSWWQDNGIADAELIDLKQVSGSMITGYRDSALNRLLIGILAITVILSAGLRSPLLALRVFLPVLLAAASTIALLGVTGQPVSLFHLIALLLMAGIGIDYSLFAHRLATHPNEGNSIANAILICAVTTITIFGILALSPIPVLKAIGITVAMGVPLCLLFILALPHPGTGRIKLHTART